MSLGSRAVVEDIVRNYRPEDIALAFARTTKTPQWLVRDMLYEWDGVVDYD